MNQARSRVAVNQHSETAPVDFLGLTARLTNDLADVAELELDFPSADDYRRQVLTLFEESSGEPDGFRVIEQGRAHLGLGAYRPERTGLFARWSELVESDDDVALSAEYQEDASLDHLNAAVGCFMQRAEDSTENRMLLAQAHLERARYQRAMQREWQSDDERAIDLLTQLFREHPRNPDLRHQFAVALANLPVCPDADDDSAEHRRRLERAREFAYSLTRSHPQFVRFVETDIDIRHKLAELSLSEANSVDAVELLRAANSYRKSLSVRFPQQLRSRIDQALIKWRLAGILVQVGNLTTAERLQDRAQRQFDYISSDQLEYPVVVATLEILDGTRHFAAIPTLEPVADTSDTDQ